MSTELKDSAPVPLAEISQGPNAFEQFLDKNQKNLVILSILVALGVAGWVVYRGIQQSTQETAGAAFSTAEDLPALQKVVTEHAGTKAASSAMILLAERQWTEGQQDNALETLSKFIAENPQHPALATAMASLGAKQMTQGKTGDAQKTFEEILANPSARFIAPFALISLGDIAQAAGDVEKAKGFYSKVAMDHPESGFSNTANSRIASISTKAPVEVAPPPPPPAPAATPAPGAPAMPGGLTPPPTGGAAPAPAEVIPATPVTPPAEPEKPASTAP